MYLHKSLNDNMIKSYNIFYRGVLSCGVEVPGRAKGVVMPKVAGSSKGVGRFSLREH